MAWTPDAIVGAVTLLVLCLGWFMRLEHRLSKSMTYDVYERLDRDRNQTIEKLLERLETKLDERDREATRHRDWVRDQLTSMWMEISALQAEAGIFYQRRQLRAPSPKESHAPGETKI